MLEYIIGIISLYFTIMLSIFITNDLEMRKYDQPQLTTEEIPVRWTKDFYIANIAIILTIVIIAFIIKFKEVLNRNSFWNIVTLLLLLLFIIWYGYLLDKNRKDEPIEKGIADFTLIMDGTLLFFMGLILLDVIISRFKIEFSSRLKIAHSVYNIF